MINWLASTDDYRLQAEQINFLLHFVRFVHFLSLGLN